MATPGQPKPIDVSFNLTTPQIGNTVVVCLDINAAAGILWNRLTVPPEFARQLAAALLGAAQKAEKQIVVPMGGIAQS